jgi:hypothetical protein
MKSLRCHKVAAAPPTPPQAKGRESKPNATAASTGTIQRVPRWHLQRILKLQPTILRQQELQSTKGTLPELQPKGTLGNPAKLTPIQLH